ncbi:hypothetical protein RFI_37874 [Reticulomyxa filosa]|uniref:SAM domain-containing protein n=1 Tax=Reticulomyxa filosa TaxID=46433 RepID=X6LFS6_RETFI|nr:hypothetical protein RFI_37874 [Reticulomyxa filosa]|eukprot:ETN99594.1 hypothetical protein RFI_37874 [Reticulomyxa filosa]
MIFIKSANSIKKRNNTNSCAFVLVILIKNKNISNLKNYKYNLFVLYLQFSSKKAKTTKNYCDLKKEWKWKKTLFGGLEATMGACNTIPQDIGDEEAIFRNYKLDTTPFQKWNTEQVYQWVLHCENGQLRHTAKQFRREGIDGSLLLLITEAHLRNDLNMKELRDRLRFQKAIAALRSRYNKMDSALFKSLFDRKSGSDSITNNVTPLVRPILAHENTPSVICYHKSDDNEHNNPNVACEPSLQRAPVQTSHHQQINYKLKKTATDSEMHFLNLSNPIKPELKQSNSLHHASLPQNVLRSAGSASGNTFPVFHNVKNTNDVNVSLDKDIEWSEEQEIDIVEPDQTDPLANANGNSNGSANATANINKSTSDQASDELKPTKAMNKPADHYQSVNALHISRDYLNVIDMNQHEDKEFEEEMQRATSPISQHSHRKLLSMSMPQLPRMNSNAFDMKEMDAEHALFVEGKLIPKMWNSDPKVFNLFLSFLIIQNNNKINKGTYKKKECRLAYELARTFNSRLSALASQARRNSRQIHGYRGYFGKDIYQHMIQMKMDCCLMQNLLSLPSIECLSSKASPNGSLHHLELTWQNSGENGKCTHKNKSCCFVNCELLLRHGYLGLTGQKTRGNRLPPDPSVVAFSPNKDTIYAFNRYLFLKNKRFFEILDLRIKPATQVPSSKQLNGPNCPALFAESMTETVEPNLRGNTNLACDGEKKQIRESWTKGSQLEIYHINSQGWIPGQIISDNQDRLIIIYLSPQTNALSSVLTESVWQQITVRRDSPLLKPIIAFLKFFDIFWSLEVKTHCTLHEGGFLFIYYYYYAVIFDLLNYSGCLSVIKRRKHKLFFLFFGPSLLFFAFFYGRFFFYSFVDFYNLIKLTPI